MRVLVVGCGYVGLPLGAALVKQGHKVFGLRRTSSANAQLKAAGIEPWNTDITRLPELQKLPHGFDWVVNTVSSSKGGPDDYREVYLGGMRNLIAWLKPGPLKKFVYTSSTSVYGQADGSLVDERSPTMPTNETSRVLLETERVLLDVDTLKAGHQAKTSPVRCPPFRVPESKDGNLGCSASPPAKRGEGPGEEGWSCSPLILRVAGIYGPERGYWLQQYLRGEARIAGRGERILNMIHRDDLVGIVIAALEHGEAGEVYNAVDDEPIAQIDLFRWLSKTLGRPIPPLEAGPEEVTRKRGLTNKRISNRKLKKELSYVFKYPTFREGFTAELQRLEERRL